MKTMYKGLVNSPETTITNNIGTNDTIIYVLDPARVPSDLPNLMVLGTGTNAETIKVTAIEDNALTVERGFQGIAKDWLAGTIISRNFTEYDYAALVDNINELELTKETPDGAQAKADTAEGNAKTYASDLIGVLSNLKTTVKDKIVSAINELFDNLASHKADKAPHTATPKCRVYNSTNQSIADSTLTVLAFNSERFDNDSMHDNSTNNSRITVKTAGKGVAYVSLAFVNNATGFRSVNIKLNGTTIIAQETKQAVNGSYTSFSFCTVPYDFALNDYIEIIVYQNSGGPLDVVYTNGSSAEFGIEVE